MGPSTIILIQAIIGLVTTLLQLLAAYLMLKKVKIEAETAKKLEQNKNPNRSRRKGRS